MKCYTIEENLSLMAKKINVIFEISEPKFSKSDFKTLTRKFVLASEIIFFKKLPIRRVNKITYLYF